MTQEEQEQRESELIEEFWRLAEECHRLTPKQHRRHLPGAYSLIAMTLTEEQEKELIEFLQNLGNHKYAATLGLSNPPFANEIHLN